MKKIDITRGIVSAEYEGETIYIGIVAIKKTKYVGYLDDSAKLRSNGTITGKVGSTFDLRNLNNMIGKDVIASYKVEKSGVIKKYLYFATMEELLPQISMPKKQLAKAEVTYDQTGSIATFKPTSDGKYKIVYSLRDGSGKRFVLTIKAEN